MFGMFGMPGGVKHNLITLVIVLVLLLLLVLSLCVTLLINHVHSATTASNINALYAVLACTALLVCVGIISLTGPVITITIGVLLYLIFSDRRARYRHHSAGYATCGNLTPLTQFVSEFQCSSNLDTLIPQLCQRCALSVDEIQELNSVFYHKRSNQILLLLVILTRKGKGGVVSLIESLESDKEHPGHWDLAQLLRSQYDV